MTVLITIYLARRVVRPVRRTAVTAERLAAGELDARVPETSSAEVGVLERAFNSMAESLQHHVGELARLSDEQAALRRVATLVARGRPSDEVFAAVAEEMARCVRVMHATVSRYDAEAFIPVAIYHGDRLQKLPEDLRLPLDGDNVAARVFRSGRTARMDSHDDAPGLHAARIRELGIRSAVGVPIIVEGRVWGAAIVGSSAPEPLPPDTEARIGDFADLVATAIANAATRAELIASRVRIVAAGDDARRRLERDLHDGAQQRLVALGLHTRLAEASVPPSPSSSAVSAAADVWTSRSGKPHPHGRGRERGTSNQPRKADRPCACPRSRATTTTARSTPRSTAPARRTSATSACRVHGVAVAGGQGGPGALRAAEVQHGAGRLLTRRLEPRRPHELPGPTAPAQPGDRLARPARGTPPAGGGPRLRHERQP